MKRSLALLALAALTLTGCVATVEPEPAPETSAPVETVEAVETETAEPEPSEAETPEAALVDRGFIHKEIGEEGGLLSPSANAPAVTFAVTEIVRDFQCTNSYPPTPSNDEFVGLHFDVTVTDAFDPEEMFMQSFTLYPNEFQAFTADGSRVNDTMGNALDCASMSDSLPRDIGKGQSASGWYVLDLPSDAVAVAYVIDGTGWEWQLP